MSGAIHIAGIAWYNGLNGYLEPNCPSLAICFESGRCQIMKNDIDESKFVVLTKLEYMWQYFKKGFFMSTV